MWCCFFIFELTRAHQPSHSWRQRATVGKENTAYYYFPPVPSAYSCPTACLPPKGSLLLIMCDHPRACQLHFRLTGVIFSWNLALIQKELHCSLSKPLLIALMAATTTQWYSCSSCYMGFFFTGHDHLHTICKPHNGDCISSTLHVPQCKHSVVARIKLC